MRHLPVCGNAAATRRSGSSQVDSGDICTPGTSEREALSSTAVPCNPPRTPAGLSNGGTGGMILAPQVLVEMLQPWWHNLQLQHHCEHMPCC
ncbi:hypothetical protein EJB05_13138, partial [Eragrostis curvula]